MHRTLWLAIAAAGMLTSGGAQAAKLHFSAVMNGASEVPAVATAGKGRVAATLDTKTRRLSYSVEFSGLSGPAMAAHIHGPAAPGEDAPVLFPFAKPHSPIKGSVKLTPKQEKELEAGEFYVNVHTAQHKGGEIRGQLEPAK